MAADNTRHDEISPEACGVTETEALLQLLALGAEEIAQGKFRDADDALAELE